MQLLIGIVICCTLLVWAAWDKVLWQRSWRWLPIVLLAPALVGTVNEYRWYSFERSLSVATSPITGTVANNFGCERLTRNFWASRGLPGHVLFTADGVPHHEAFLSAKMCAGIERFQRNPAAADDDAIMAVHVLSHEAVHLTGVRSESLTECLALQMDEDVMMRMGAPAAVAAAAAHRYRTNIYPRLSAEYKAESCAPWGGAEHRAATKNRPTPAAWWLSKNQ